MVFRYFRTRFLRVGKDAGLRLCEAPTRYYILCRSEARSLQSVDVNPPLDVRVASTAPAAQLCAGHAQQFWGASPLPNLMEVKG
jgi:hypothetical protein